MSDPPDFGQDILRSILETTDAEQSPHRAGTIVDLAIITFLIDAKVATIEQFVQRLERVHRSLPDQYQDDEVAKRIAFLTEWLRAHDRKGN